MKLKKEFITHMSADKQILIDATGKQFSGLVRSNKTAAFIIDALKKETTEEEIVDAMLEQYDASRDVIKTGVEKVIQALRSIGALDE